MKVTKENSNSYNIYCKYAIELYVNKKLFEKMLQKEVLVGIMRKGN